jgi:ribonucleotide monophosphatase NagD (HAD superfamily)
VQVFFLTNNCLKTRDEYRLKLESFGIQASLNEIYCTAFLAACYFEKQKSSKLKIYSCGSPAMATELENKDIPVIGTGPDNRLSNLSTTALEDFALEPDVTHVLFGFDQHFSHTKGMLTEMISKTFIRTL